MKSITTNSPIVTVIGLGKLGAPIATAIASRKISVIGIDINPNAITAFNTGKSHLHEPLFTQYLKKYKKNISATSLYEKAIFESTITFIVVPTPSTKNGLFTNKYIIAAIKKIGAVLRQKKSYHVISIVSTVIPGSLDTHIIPALEKASHKKCAEDFGVCYNPTFVALGSVIRNFLSPDLVLIGQSDTKGGDILQRFYKKVCSNKPRIERMNIINAEITKIALNTYVTTKISYANMLAELCEYVPGAHIDTITNALGFDTRIGHKYLKGATAYGGPCFPRDNRALTATGKRFGLQLTLPAATDAVNQHQISRIVRIITKRFPKPCTIAILGLTYQAGSDVIDESVGLHLSQTLTKKKYRIIAYDPQGLLHAKKQLGSSVSYAQDIKQCVVNADVIVIATAWKQFSSLPLSFLPKHPLLIDCWRVITSQKLKSMVEYYPVGIYNSSK